MRTTVDIPDDMYRKLKSKAAQEGETVKHLVLRGVDQVLAEKEKPKRKRKPFPVIESTEPGVLVIDNEKIYEIIGFP